MVRLSVFIKPAVGIYQDAYKMRWNAATVKKLIVI